MKFHGFSVYGSHGRIEHFLTLSHEFLEKRIHLLMSPLLP